MSNRFAFFLLSFNFSLAAVAQPVYTIRVDLDNVRGGTASQVFDSIRFIPLETTKESLFGSIDQLEITDSFFIILDRRGASILVFNRNGKLHKRIITGGANKYFSYFAIDRNTNSIVVLNNYAKALLIYDFDGNLKQKQTSPEYLQSLNIFGNGTVLYNLRRPFDPGADVKVPFDLGYAHGYDSIYRYMKPFDPKIVDGQFNIMYNPISFSGQGSSCMFSLPFDYTVLQLGDTGITGKYKFVFPLSYSLPANFITDSSFKGKRAQYVYSDQDNAKKVSDISTVYRVGDYLLFSLMSGDLSMDRDYNFLYNLRNEDLLSFTKVTADSMSCYLPVLYSAFEGLNAVYNKKVYSSIPGFLLFAFKGKTDKPVKYPAELQDYFTNGTKNNNPVILELNLKPNL
jgi:hypothetical protein